METQIDIPLCPKGHGNMKKIKEWELKGKFRGNTETGTLIELWKCPVCNAQLRIPKKLKT